MVTRSKKGVFKPKAYMSLSTNCFEKEPLSVKHALTSSEWFDCMKIKLNSLLRNKTWVLVPPPFNITIIGSKCIFHVKTLPYDVLDK